MKYDYSVGMFGNIIKLFDERNKHNNEIMITQKSVNDNQSETDEMLLDYEERLILLEVGDE